MSLKPRGNTPEPEPKKKGMKIDPTKFSSFKDILGEIEKGGIEQLKDPDIYKDIMDKALEAAKLIDEIVVLHDKMVLDPTNMDIGEQFVNKMKEIINGDEKIAITVLSAGASALSLIKSFLGPNGMPGFPGGKK